LGTKIWEALSNWLANGVYLKGSLRENFPVSRFNSFGPELGEGNWGLFGMGHVWAG